MKGAFPRVSVVLPTYNDAKFLPGAIDSVLSQTWQDFEFIIVNDGSTDNTRAVLAGYENHPQITVIHQPNGKLPSALNTGFRQARGQYLTWTSTDNFMLPTMLETLVAALDQTPHVGLVYADWQVLDEQGQPLGVVQTLDYDRYVLMRLNYINACFLYRRECQEDIGFYDPEYILAEDWEYWWRISQRFNMLRVPKVLYQYRHHGGSLTHFILTKQGGISTGYRKLSNCFRANRLAWYWSKVKYEMVKRRLGRNPLRLQPLPERETL